MPQKPRRSRTLILISAILVAGALYGASSLVSELTDSAKSSDDSAAPIAHDCVAPIAYPGKLPSVVKIDAQAQAFAVDLVGRHPSVLTLAVGIDLRTAREILRDGTVHGRPLTTRQRPFFGRIAGGAKTVLKSTRRRKK